ncbi:MAG: hypothetical protein H6R01_1989 [Burkholderiaceae bacterium]|nr:hypothetical protein [Burkholderiaceae bacterium]
MMGEVEVKWRPVVAVESHDGTISVLRGELQDSRIAAIALAEKFINEVGERGLWCSAVRVKSGAPHEK